MKTGFTCSAFDLLHAGHIQMLREAKEQCDYLICGLQIDPSLDREEKNAPNSLGDDFWWYDCAKGLFFPAMQVFKTIVQILPVQPVFPYKRFCGRS